MQLRPPEWTKSAACIPYVPARGGPDPWHPDDMASARYQRQSYDWARQICLGCPVRVQCLRRGVELLNEIGPEEGAIGMWGGLEPEALGKLARRIGRSSRKAAACGTRSGYVGHRSRGEEPCASCRSANAEVEHSRRVAKSGPPNSLVVTEKYCPRCKQVKAAGDFWPHRGSSDGLMGICKVCTSKTCGRRQSGSNRPVIIPRGATEPPRKLPA